MSNTRSQCALGVSRETLSAWRDRVLPDTDARRIAQHLPTCPTCQARLTQFTRIAAAIQRQPAPDLRARTWRGIQARLARNQRRPVSHRLRRAVAFSRIGASVLVAALIVLFALIFSQRPHPGGGPTTPGASPTVATTPASTCPTFPAGYHDQLPDPGYTTTSVYANIPLPPMSQIVPNNAAGGQRGYDICGTGTAASISSYMADHLAALGWTSAGDGIWTKDGYRLTVRVPSPTDWNISWRDPDQHP